MSYKYDSNYSSKEGGCRTREKSGTYRDHARRLRAVGGDEFIAVIGELDSHDEIRRPVARLLAALAGPVELEQSRRQRGNPHVAAIFPLCRSCPPRADGSGAAVHAPTVQAEPEQSECEQRKGCGFGYRVL